MLHPNKKIAVLIPCYNEASTIEDVVKGFNSYLPDADIYVYDNNSTDNTAEIARNAGAIVRYEVKQGKGNVVKTMFREIEADCYIMTDGDNTYPPEYAPEMISYIIDNGIDMVIGDRLSATYDKENKRAFHSFGNKLVRKLINYFFKSDIKDIMTGYRAFSYQFVKSCPVLSKGFEVETEITIHALEKNLKIKMIPIAYKDRPEGSFSKLNTFSDGFKIIVTIFNLYKNNKPFKFFCTFASVFLIISTLLFLRVLPDYIETGLVPKFPSLIASGFFLVLSMISFAIGTICDLIVENNKKNFEIQRNMIQIMQSNKNNK